MLYTLLGRIIWKVFRGYMRHEFPHARRNFTTAGIVALALAGAWTGRSARRRTRPG